MPVVTGELNVEPEIEIISPTCRSEIVSTPLPEAANIKVSFPAAPESILLPLLPVMEFARALPVALILVVPRRYRFSTWAIEARL